MPLAATLEGKQLLAPLVPPARWAAMKGRTPRPMLVCGTEAYVKNSVRGTPFFAHAARCDQQHKGESPTHLRLKAALITAAVALGWDAHAEVPADDRSWIADVLAERDGRRVVFEVQIASQNLEGYRHRQDRYEQDGVEAFWLTSRANTMHLRGVPAVRVDPAADELTVTHRARSGDGVPLSEFVAAILDKDLRWASVVPTPVSGSIRWGVHICKACQTPTTVWAVAERAEAACPRCERRRPAQRLSPHTPPRHNAARLGVTAPEATWHRMLDGGLPAFSCPTCSQFIPPGDLWWLYNAGAPVDSTVTLNTAWPGEAHWCAPAFALEGPDDVVAYLSGSAPVLPAPVLLDRRTADDLVHDARRRHQLHADQDVARDAARRRTEERERWLAERLREFEVARPVLDPTTSGLPSVTGAMPTNAHERTAAIDAYVLAHLGLPTEDVRDLFPSFTERCTCSACAAIERTYRLEESRILWPERKPLRPAR